MILLKGASFEDVKINEILSLIEDIMWFFGSEEIDKYKRNQGIIGMSELLQECIAKVQIRTNFSSNKYRVLDKIAKRIYIQYYCKC